MKGKAAQALELLACGLVMVHWTLAPVSGQTDRSHNASQAVPGHSPLARRYTEGEKLTYHMTGNNDGWRYEVQAHGIVKKDASGHLVEEYGWSDFKSNAALSLTPASLSFRQTLSLDPDLTPTVPDLSQIQPMLIGPITDLLTFYSDLWLAMRQDNLKHSGDHAYVRFGRPASWADGNSVVLGEDSIDFDLTLQEVDAVKQVATLLVRHVPPREPEVKLPVEWMHTPVRNTPNNWVQVRKSSAGKYEAEVGQETFEVEIKVSLVDGKILSAKLDNAVEAVKRECSDAALSACGAPARHQIVRQIELRLAP